MNKILIVEDEDALRELIAFNLTKAGYDVIESENANDALIFIEEITPDLIILDIMMPGLKGTQLLQLLKRSPKFSNIPVIIISARSSESDIVEGLELGADDYITKPFSMKVLIAKIKILLRKKQEKTENIIEYKGIIVDLEKYKVFLNNKEITLTYKEFELLVFFLKHPKKVFSRSQLLSNIWGYDADIFTRTVDSHVSSLRKKLEDKGNLIKSLPKVGYLLD
ncbi:response regulator [Calditerrivibrio nitroreducens]|uniref:Two component transcriptional regulator, winged helix family n=1 Tax=Calditerrivibrio nitroreducens (strain DSM 19672 / NBRC 101217 / Yu37-1) TaxID=768670 RepID=E4TF38_CALNY|nr:response regulator [Calditerrivibrio nitroreducens]ADR19478.1 two component transcriptional regulator, winged helix family [Calditerrivibrio nitroreducens DSM 19672]